MVSQCRVIHNHVASPVTSKKFNPFFKFEYSSYIYQIKDSIYGKKRNSNMPRKEKYIILLTMAFKRDRSLSVTKVTAYPSLPARAVRPTR